MKTHLNSHLLGAYNSVDNTFFLELIFFLCKVQSFLGVVAVLLVSRLIHHVFSSGLSLKHAVF